MRPSSSLPVPPPRSGARWAWGAASIYLAAALWMLYPAWLDPLHGVIGDWRHPDMISNHWLYRWTADRLLAGGGLLHNDRYYLPVGDGPWLAGNGSDAVFSVVVAALLPWPLSVTAWCALALVLNGLSGFALARAAGARHGGALVAGAFLVLSPYVAYEMSGMRLAQVPLYWMGFFLAAWLRLLAAPSARRAAGAGLLFAAAAFVYWYYGLWLAVVGAALFLARPRWRALAVFLPVALAGTAPFLAIFFGHWAEIPGTGDGSFPHPLAAQSSLPPTFPFWAIDGALPALVLPLTLLALAALGWRARAGLSGGGRTAGVLLALAALFALLCLGPAILFPDGTATGIPGPYRLAYGGLATLRRFWWPYRHVAAVLLCLLPLGALGWDAASAWLAGRFAGVPGRLAGPVLALATLAALPLEQGLRGATAGVHTSWWQAPEAYERLAALPGDAILELPLAPALARSQQTLSYQWVHGKKLVNGHAMWVDRVRPDAWDAWVAQNRLLAGLQAYESGAGDGRIALGAADVRALLDLGVRHIVVNTEYFPGDLVVLPPRYQQILTALFGPPVLDFRGVLQAWDLAGYTGVGEAAAGTFSPSSSDLATDGTWMPDAGVVLSLGWMPLDRRFPPTWPDPGAQERALDALPPMLRNKLRRTDLGPGPGRR